MPARARRAIIGAVNLRQAPGRDRAKPPSVTNS